MLNAARKEKLLARGKGSIEVANYTNSKVEKFELVNIWYGPSISQNLFLVLTTHDRNPHSTFRSDQDQYKFVLNGKTVFISTRETNGTLYCTSFHTPKPTIEDMRERR